MGSSVFSDNEIYEQIVPFVKDWRQKMDTNGHIPLFFATVDVEKAYDNIVQSKLMSIMERILDCVLFLTP